MTPMIFTEVVHVAMKALFKAEIPHHHADLAARFPSSRRYSWHQLYKVRSDLLGRFMDEMERMHSLLIANGLFVLQPTDLAVVLGDRPTTDEALLELMRRYMLATNDATILLEARRAGVLSIASLDGDLRRAALDFDVYTWE